MKAWLQELQVILLGAGASRRFGSSDKLCQPLLGKPLFEYTLEAVENLAIGYTKGVLSCNASPLMLARCRRANIGLTLVNTNSMLESLQAGLAGLENVAASSMVAILPLDLPLMSEAALLGFFQKVARHCSLGNSWIARPVVGAVPGHPVVFSGCFIDALRGLEPGAKPVDVARANSDSLRMYHASDLAYIQDVDTPQALLDAEALLRKRQSL